jgi:thiol-disulfide isomerase/thioredoxin
MGSQLLRRYAMIGTDALSAHRMNDETITLEGTPRPCFVLEVTYRPTTDNPQVKEGPRTYWIDRATHLVLRQLSTVEVDSPQLGGRAKQIETITFTRAQIDPVFSDTMWTFRPPAGSQEMDSIGPQPQPPPSAMEGEVASDFTLRDLLGKTHTLARLKGKVVLLDFWATWCGPCRLTMPRVAKIHQEYKGKGVEVFSINVGEPAARAGAYIKKNGYAFTTLLDTDTQVATHYKVTGIPTLVVIDRNGTISSYLVGAHPEQTMRDALAKAGVK